MKCELHAIEIEGFKVFKERCRVGPFPHVSCVVGANGCGKSCMIEAVAFALGGGNTRLIRKQNLNALINTHRLREGNRTAQVIVSMKISEENAIHYFHIKRRISPSGLRLHTSATHSPLTSDWEPCTQASRHDERLTKILQSYRIPAEMLERCIVMQSQRAVDASHPPNLLKHLEICAGTEAIRQRIATLEKQETTHRAMQLEAAEKLQKLECDVEEKILSLGQLREAGQKRRALQQRMRTDQKRRAQLERELSSLREECCNGAERIEGKKFRIQLLRMVCRNWESDVRSLQSRIDEQEEAICVKRAKWRLLSRQQKAEGDRQGRQREDLDGARCEAAKLMTEISKLEDEGKSLGAEMAALESQLKKQHPGVGGADRRRAVSEVEHSRLLVQALESRLEKLQDNAAAKGADLNLKRKLLEEMEEKQAMLRSEQHLQENKISRLSQELQAAERGTAALQLQQKATKAELLAAQATLTAITESSINLQSLEKYHSSITHLQSALSANSLHGRLHSLARVKNAADAVAVNSVLHDLVDLFSFLVVADASTAKHVIAHFAEERIGWVNCRILDEIETSPPKLLVSGWPCLVDCLEVRDPEYLKLFEWLLGSWIVMNDAREAVDYRQRNRASQVRCNIVTKDGVLFKWDGEICAPSDVLPHRALCSIQGDFQKDMAYTDGRQTGNCVEDLRQKIQKLQIQNTSLGKEFREGRSAVAQLRLGVQLDEEKSVLKELRDRCCEANQRTKALRSDLKESQNQWIERREPSCQSASQNLQSELSKAKDVLRQSRLALYGSEDALVWEDKLHTLRSKLEENNAKSHQLKSERRRVEEEIRSLNRRLQISRSRGKEMAALEKDVQDAQLSLDEKTVHIRELGKEMAALQKRLAQLESDLGPLKELCNKSRAEYLRKERAWEKRQVEMARLRIQLKASLECLGQFCGRESSKQRWPVNTCSLLPTSADGQAAATSLWSATGANPSNTGQDQRLPDLDLDEEMTALLSFQLKSWDSAQHFCPWKSIADFEQEHLQIMAEEERVNAAAPAAEPETPSEALIVFACERQKLLDEISHHRSLLSQCQTEKAALERERLETLLHTLKTVNSHLSEIYSILSTGEGDAQCRYSANPAVLFQSGVELYCKPNRCFVGGGSFSLLSAGQQSLVTLALSFAVQATFPCPFYFFDELDCALDKKRAMQVIMYIQQQINAQYILVSHKTHVVEAAQCLIGVTSTSQVSTLLPLLFSSVEKKTG